MQDPKEILEKVSRKLPVFTQTVSGGKKAILLYAWLAIKWFASKVGECHLQSRTFWNVEVFSLVIAQDARLIIRSLVVSI